MGWFSFLKRNEYDINGRTIKIIDKIDEFIGDMQKVKTAILEVCANDEYAKKTSIHRNNSCK